MTDATPEEIDIALRGIRAVVGLVTRSTADALEQVTLPQLRVLILLESVGDLQVGELGTVLGVSASAATRAAARMARDGWLDRIRSDADRRAVALRLTSRGRALVEHVVQRRREEVQTAFAGLTDAQRRTVVDGLRVLADSFDEPEERAATLRL